MHKMQVLYEGYRVVNQEALDANKFRVAAGVNSRGFLSKENKEVVDRIKERKALVDSLNVNVSELVAEAELKKREAFNVVLTELGEAQETIRKLNAKLSKYIQNTKGIVTAVVSKKRQYVDEVGVLYI